MAIISNALFDSMYVCTVCTQTIVCHRSADLRYKEKERKGRAWEIAQKITREEYTLDWSQSRVFLFLILSNAALFTFSQLTCRNCFNRRSLFTEHNLCDLCSVTLTRMLYMYVLSVLFNFDPASLAADIIMLNYRTQIINTQVSIILVICSTSQPARDLWRIERRGQRAVVPKLQRSIELLQLACRQCGL